MGLFLKLFREKYQLGNCRFGTVKENIVFDRNISDEEVKEALERVELLCLVDELPNGIDTQIGEKASSLSGGERQRLALSRIWFKESDIVIFDEATSALDNLNFIQ